jgi:hypothetical protein
MTGNKASIPIRHNGASSPKRLAGGQSYFILIGNAYAC